MNPTKITEITESSFRVEWNHSEAQNEEIRTLYLYEGNSSIHIYRIPNIPSTGSQLFTNLKPNVEYRAVIETGLINSNVFALDTNYATTLQIEQSDTVGPGVTATQLTYENNTLRNIALFLGFLFLLLVGNAVRKRMLAE